MKTLKLADNLSLPIETVTQTIAILAKRRAGKSYTMRRLVEQLFKAGQQVVLVDPKGDQWGLRSSADGKSAGLPIVIFGGERGDVPLEVGAGELVAKLVVEERVSALLDLSLFRKREVATFMTAFLEGLYRLKAKEVFRTPVMLVIDEADAIAPQKPQDGEERMLGAAEDIVRRGGQRGIGCVLVTQRSAVLNKNVLTQAEVLVALRTIAPQDLKAMNEWIDVHGTPEQRVTLMQSLPALPVGDAWFWSPGWPTADGIFKRVHILPIETFDSGASPKPGVKPIEVKTLADVDLTALKGQMAETIERSKADDPKELRKLIQEKDRKIQSLEGKILQLEKAKPAGKTVEILTDADRALVVKLAAMLEDMAAKLGIESESVMADLTDRLSTLLQRAHEDAETVRLNGRQEFEALLERAGFRRIIEKLKSVPETAHIMRAGGHQDPMRVSIHPPTVKPATREALHQVARRVAAAPVDASDLPPVAVRILSALAELELLGARQPKRELVAFLAGYSNLNSKGFVNSMSALSSAGLIAYPDSGKVQLTADGQARATYPDAPRSPRDVQERVISLLGGASEKILRPIIASYPKAVLRTDVAAAAGYTNLNSKGFVNALSRLSSLGFVRYPDRGTVAAAPVLFLEAS